MPRIDRGLIPVVTDLERGLRELGVRFGLVGALVPELLLAVRPPRRTNDVDVVAVVATIHDFEAVKERLGAYGFSRTSAPYQLKHRDGGRVDILPVGGNVAPGGRLNLGDGFDLNMAGFDHVVPNAIDIPIDEGPNLPVAPLPLYVLLKLVAYTDRKASKDLGSVLHCLEHYLEEDDRRNGVDNDAAGVPNDYTSDNLLGVDGQPFLDESVRQAVTAILDRFNEPDADVVGIATGEKGRLYVDDEERTKTFELFRWYRLGAGL
jgi:predicted nucleotidyltransferase